MRHGVQGRTGSAPLDAPTAQQVADTMQALATPSRVRILGRLRESPCSVGELAEAVSMERSAVSHQLRLLRHLGLVTSERRGRSIVYALHDPHVGVLRGGLPRPAREPRALGERRRDRDGLVSETHAHDHAPHDHGHAHGLVDPSVLRSRAGLRAVALSLAILGLTALVQAAVFALASSVALLADLIHTSATP